MKIRALLPALLLTLAAGAAAAQSAPATTSRPGLSFNTNGHEQRTDFIDPATGHRVIRLSVEDGSASFYFHQNPFTDRGDKMAINLRSGIATIDLTTLGRSPCKVERIADGMAQSGIVGKKNRTVYYYSESKGGTILATNLDTHETRPICKLPEGLTGASGIAINSNETMLASTGDDPDAREIVATQPARPSSKIGVLEGKMSKVLFTVEIATGKLQKIHYSTYFLNHTQFSPSDPEQLLFCHEGSWHSVDRIWTIRSDGTGLKLMHSRTMPYEIAGHEFFSFDGAQVWYDLQTPRSKEFWLAGVDIHSGARIRYPLERRDWSVHYNQSHDGKLFCGDGGGPNSVANHTPMPENSKISPPANGPWIYLFTPASEADSTLTVGGDTIAVGKLKVERLVNMSQHDYNLEPNATFTPDNKWLVFRSNMSGYPHVYAVEIARHTSP